ncbi:hypothetical protein V8E51_006146 [Hyaloscypha variabilis]
MEGRRERKVNSSYGVTRSQHRPVDALCVVRLAGEEISLDEPGSLGSSAQETVDLTLGQQFQLETSGSSRFPMPEDMTAAEFQEALDVDSNHVVARVQMHTHSNTCTEYQKKFPRSQSMVTEEGYIRMERSHQFVNEYNPVITSATGYNHDVNFTASSPKVLPAIYYMTNYATKAQVYQGQFVLATALLKKAQETAEAAAAENRLAGARTT